MFLRLMLAAALLIPAVAGSAETNEAVASPDGHLVLTFSLDGGTPRYQLRRDQVELVLPSALGFVLSEAPPMTNGFAMVEAVRNSADETWKPVWGTASKVRNRYNELTVRLREAGGLERGMDVVFRVFDDGVGFRYLLPAQSNLAEVLIVSEETAFRFAGDYLAWWHEVDYDGDEKTYRTDPLSHVKAVNTPLTMRTPEGIHLSIHEAALVDYASMTLVPVSGEPQSFKADLVPGPERARVKRAAPMKTPWRTIQVTGRAGGLMESHLIENLNEPCAIADTSWIEPMKYMGIWWSLHINKEEWAGNKTNHGATTANAKRYIDFASSNGIRGLLIEGWNKGWETWFNGAMFSFTEPYPDFDLEAVAKYARGKGVALIGHHETGGNILLYESQMEAAFSLYERLGIRAVKTGYAGEIIPRGQHHHGQWMVRHYQKVTERAAAHRIALDVHEPIKPTGLCRTWPNLMSGEGVRGTEYEAWSTGNPPEHTTIIPFTRCLAGPVDYTPGIFAMGPLRHPDTRMHTTVAKQLALYVVLFSPLQMAADLPENYEGKPAFQFIRDVPATWDETRVLSAEVGDFIVAARRKGDAWYLGAITDENARELEAPLSFLDPEKEYEARIYADGKDADWETNPAAVAISTRTVTAKDTLKLSLARSGGQAVSLVPKKP